MDNASQPLLDALDHLCLQVDGDPEIEQKFYGATTPEELVALAVESGILIDADDFRALLRSGAHHRRSGWDSCLASVDREGYLIFRPGGRSPEISLRLIGHAFFLTTKSSRK